MQQNALKEERETTTTVVDFGAKETTTNFFLWLSSSPLVLPEDKAKKSEWSSSSVTQIISNLSVVLETLRKLFV